MKSSTESVAAVPARLGADFQGCRRTGHRTAAARDALSQAGSNSRTDPSAAGFIRPALGPSSTIGRPRFLGDWCGGLQGALAVRLPCSGTRGTTLVSPKGYSHRDVHRRSKGSRLLRSACMATTRGQNGNWRRFQRLRCLGVARREVKSMTDGGNPRRLAELIFMSSSANPGPLSPNHSI